MKTFYLISVLLIASTLQAKGTKQKREEMLADNVTKHLARITTEMDNIQAQLQSVIPYNLPVAITSVPYTISTPGSYYVPKDLAYTGAQAAITVSADNVTINFYNNSLQLSNPAATGILVQAVHEFTLENCIIQDAANGIVFSGCAGARVANSFMNNSGITSTGSRSLFITQCGFKGTDAESSTALTLQNSSSHINISNSTFSNWQTTIAATDVTGLQIDGCIVTGSETAPGNPLILTTTTNAHITNSAFSGSDKLLFASGSGCIMENVVVEIDGPAALEIDAFNDLLAKKCLFASSGDYGLSIASGSNIHCIQCQFTDATLANIQLTKATGCLFTNCKISDAAGSGIVVDSGSTGNTILNCEISNNGQNGITIAAQALQNQLMNNNVFDNGSYGIVNNEPTSAIFNNISCNNGVSDCPSGGVTPVQAPGVSPLVPGSNICCIP